MVNFARFIVINKKFFADSTVPGGEITFQMADSQVVDKVQIKFLSGNSPFDESNFDVSDGKAVTKQVLKDALGTFPFDILGKNGSFRAEIHVVKPGSVEPVTSPTIFNIDANGVPRIAQKIFFDQDTLLCVDAPEIEVSLRVLIPAADSEQVIRCSLEPLEPPDDLSITQVGGTVEADLIIDPL